MTTSELPAGADQERLADRLLRSTAARSYDPELDIDWSAPPQEGKLFLPEHRGSLYGTAMWNGSARTSGANSASTRPPAWPGSGSGLNAS